MTRKQKFFAAAAALAALFLIGCSNGLVGDATVSGGSSETRSASIYITNFGNTALRTIAPEHLDVVTNTDLIFVATGSSARKDMTPQLVTVSNGRVDLSSLEAGIWTLTITAYDKNKLSDPAMTDGTAIHAERGTAAVLAGSATVDLTRGNGDVNVTLIPKGVGTIGDVNLKVKFDPTDIATIRGNVGTTYTITIGLYEKLTLNELQEPANVVQQVTSPPASEVAYAITGVKTGEYIFQVKITSSQPGTGPWTYSDNIYIEGNRATTATVELPQLIGTAPAEPENFAIYWDKTKADVTNEKYTAQFAWDRKAYNESFYELEIVDITDNYTYTNRKHQYKAVDVNTGTALWTQIDADKANIPENQKFLLGENFARSSYPIYNNAGSLLAGNTSIEYELQTGRIYTARIRAVNKHDVSDWVYLDDSTTPPAAGWVASDAVKKFESFFFNVYSIIYDLSGYMLLQEGKTAPNEAVINQQFEYVAYDPITPHPMLYQVYHETNNDQGYQLYDQSFAGVASKDSEKRYMYWNGWMDSIDSTKIYNNDNPNYDGHANITVIPCGINGATLETVSAGTYAKLLDENTVLASIETTTTAPGWTVADHAFVNQNKDVANAEIGIGQLLGVYGFNLDSTTRNSPYYLYLTIGENDATTGTFVDGHLYDESNRAFTPISVTYSLTDAEGWTRKKTVTGTTTAYLDITGLNDGDYTLTVEAKTDTSYTFTWQTPIIVKYNNYTL